MIECRLCAYSCHITNSGVSDVLKTVDGVVKTLKDMKIMENLDLPKLMKMVQMMNALNKGKKSKTKNKLIIKRPKL